MRAVKALVIGMGVLIIVMMGFVVYGVLRQADGLSEKASAAAYESDLIIPAGCSLASADAAGDGLALIKLSGTGAECSHLLIVDLASGKLRGKLEPKMQQ